MGGDTQPPRGGSTPARRRLDPRLLLDRSRSTAAAHGRLRNPRAARGRTRTRGHRTDRPGGAGGGTDRGGPGRRWPAARTVRGRGADGGLVELSAGRSPDGEHLAAAEREHG